jgi:hypothetical protein
MTKIAILQENFKKHLYQKSQEEILQELPYESAEALARLNIYRRNVFGNFNSVLQSIYEVVAKVLGEKYFAQICKIYLEKNFSKSGNLDDFGLNFPKFLQENLSLHKLTYLPDLARLDLAFHQAHFAKISEIFPLQKFQKLSEENYFNLQFKLHPSIQILKSNYAIFSIWKNANENLQKKVKAERPEFVMVERVFEIVNIYKISELEFLFLQNISKNCLFETYQKIVKITGEEFDIGALLNKFVGNGVIVNFKLKKV